MNAAAFGGRVRQFGSDGNDMLGADVYNARVVQNGGDDTDYIFAGMFASSLFVLVLTDF